jgi:hypothetical protein
MDCNQLEATLNALSGRFAAQDAKIAELERKQIECCSRADNTRIAELERKQTELERKQIECCNAANDALSKAVQALASIASIASDVASIISDVATITSSLAALATALASLEGIVAGTAATVAGLTASVGNLLISIGTLNILGTRIDELERGLQSQSSSISDLYTKVTRIKSQMEQCCSEIMTVLRQIDDRTYRIDERTQLMEVTTKIIAGHVVDIHYRDMPAILDEIRKIGSTPGNNTDVINQLNRIEFKSDSALWKLSELDVKLVACCALISGLVAGQYLQNMFNTIAGAVAETVKNALLAAGLLKINNDVETIKNVLLPASSGMVELITCEGQSIKTQWSGSNAIESINQHISASTITLNAVVQLFCENIRMIRNNTDTLLRFTFDDDAGSVYTTACGQNINIPWYGPTRYHALRDLLIQNLRVTGIVGTIICQKIDSVLGLSEGGTLTTSMPSCGEPSKSYGWRASGFRAITMGQEMQIRAIADMIDALCKKLDVSSGGRLEVKLPDCDFDENYAWSGRGIRGLVLGQEMQMRAIADLINHLCKKLDISSGGRFEVTLPDCDFDERYVWSGKGIRGLVLGQEMQVRVIADLINHLCKKIDKDNEVEVPVDFCYPINGINGDGQQPKNPLEFFVHNVTEFLIEEVISKLLGAIIPGPIDNVIIELVTKFFADQIAGALADMLKPLFPEIPPILPSPTPVDLIPGVKYKVENDKIILIGDPCKVGLAQTNLLGKIACEPKILPPPSSEQDKCYPIVLEPSEEDAERNIESQLMIRFVDKAQGKGGSAWRINIPNPRPDITCDDLRPLTWIRGNIVGKIFFRGGMNTYSYFRNADKAEEIMLAIAELSTTPLKYPQPRITLNGSPKRQPREAEVVVWYAVIAEVNSDGKTVKTKCLKCL